MSESNSLFDKGMSNFVAAKIMRGSPSLDDEILNIVGYHLEQSLEMVLKYILEINAVEYPKTHNIDQLIKIGHENSVNMYLTEYIEEHSEMFSLWEEKTRYVLGYLVERNKIDRAINELDIYYEGLVNALNGER